MPLTPVFHLNWRGAQAVQRCVFRPKHWRNKLGAAVIRPNVRGSAGYGKHYMSLDNGFKREDSVKDIGALLDWIATQDDLDEDRVAVFGGSYGGDCSRLTRFGGVSENVLP